MFRNAQSPFKNPPKRMKKLIRLLLFIIVPFPYFTELNATECKGSSSGSEIRYERPHPYNVRPRGGARPGAGRPRGGARGAFRLSDSHRQPIITDPPLGFLTHRGKNIEVWLGQNRTRIIQANCPGHAPPSRRDFLHMNFLVRLATISGSLQIVEYVNPNGELLGVRAPRITNANVMEPNDTQWFIVYFGKVFRVRINPETKAAVAITLASKSEDEVPKGQRAEEVDMDGFKFVVIRGIPNFDITGAELPKRPPPPTVVHNFRDLISGIKT